MQTGLKFLLACDCYGNITDVPQDVENVPSRQKRGSNYRRQRCAVYSLICQTLNMTALDPCYCCVSDMLS